MFGDRMNAGNRYYRGRRRESSFQKGDLKYIVLDLLRDKPRHGYDIIREFEDFSHGFYKPSPGAVYPTLQMLEDMGYASSVEQDGKKVYTITEQGLKFLEEQKTQTDNVREHVKKRWSFKKIGGMAMLMKDYHDLEDLITRGFRSMDEDKIQKISRCCSDAQVSSKFLEDKDTQEACMCFSGCWRRYRFFSVHDFQLLWDVVAPEWPWGYLYQYVTSMR
jgi:DNA-binding PadR family transcriptional regulator